jgi:hypothetical protein
MEKIKGDNAGVNFTLWRKAQIRQQTTFADNYHAKKYAELSVQITRIYVKLL